MRDFLTDDEKQSASYNLKIAMGILVAGAILGFLGGVLSFVGLGVAAVAVGFAAGNDNAFRKVDQFRAADPQAGSPVSLDLRRRYAGAVRSLITVDSRRTSALIDAKTSIEAALNERFPDSTVNLVNEILEGPVVSKPEAKPATEAA